MSEAAGLFEGAGAAAMTALGGAAFSFLFLYPASCTTSVLPGTLTSVESCTNVFGLAPWLLSAPEAWIVSALVACACYAAAAMIRSSSR